MEPNTTTTLRPSSQPTGAGPVQVSIIIPAHNPGPYLREAIASIHAQSYDDWELMVIDDDSSQDLTELIREFPRTRYLRQPHGGVSVARNNGILNTSGPLIAFMDQDDLWRPQKLARQVSAMCSDSAAAVCYCDLKLFRATDSLTAAEAEGQADQSPVVELDGSPASDDGSGESTMLRSLRFFSQRFIVPSTVMLRRSALATSGLLDPFIPFSGDFDLLIKLGSRHKVVHVPSVDVWYRKHASNFSDQYDVGRREADALVARYRSYAKSTGDRQLARSVPGLFRRPRSLYGAQAFDRARYSLGQRRPRDFLYHWTRALLFSPTYTVGCSSRWVMSQLLGSKS